MDERTRPPGGTPEGPHPPGRDDLTRLCAALNHLGARYVVVGGFAILEAGFPRFTQDLDGVDHAEASKEAVHREINGVRIPFASLRRTPGR